MFVGREKELDFLNDRYTTKGGQLVVLYGRRRVGKSEMLREFCKGKPHVFYSCREIPDKEQLVSFSSQIMKTGIPASKYIKTFESWEDAFGSITDFPSDGRKKLLVVDEFPYMCKRNNSIPSIIQTLWDEKLKKENVMIILCGSSMSFIEKELLSEKNPLYGRATGIYKLNELPFHDAVKFFPSYSYEEKILAYSILGGIPHYLTQFDNKLSLDENIMKNVLTKGCVLYSEIEFLIRQELREVSMYNTIIENIALGSTQLNDIYTKTQIDKSKISVYLKNLMDLEIVEREFSISSSQTERAVSTRGIYKLTDNFFRFWFKFVFTNYSELEGGDSRGIYKYAIKPYMIEHASIVFEDVCKSYLRRKNAENALPFHFTQIGRWWGKVNRKEEDPDGKMRVKAIETEIDIVATDKTEKKYIYGECKFKNTKVTLSDYNDLLGKTDTDRKGISSHYYLFSKAGFAKGLTETAAGNDKLTLVSLKEVCD